MHEFICTVRRLISFRVESLEAYWVAWVCGSVASGLYRHGTGINLSLSKPGNFDGSI